MVSKKLIINIPTGIHARPAGVLAKEAMKCNSDVWIINGNKKIQAKSILNIMSACIKNGSEIEVICEGNEEEKDLNTITSLIESGLGE